SPASPSATSWTGPPPTSAAARPGASGRTPPTTFTTRSPSRSDERDEPGGECSLPRFCRECAAMIRVLLAAVALALLPPGSRGEGTVVRLGVRPMAAPKPALKYLLLPEVRELNPGNPVQWYVRCFQEQRNFFYSKEATAARARYRSLPLGE